MSRKDDVHVYCLQESWRRVCTSDGPCTICLYSSALHFMEYEEMGLSTRSSDLCPIVASIAPRTEGIFINRARDARAECWRWVR